MLEFHLDDVHGFATVKPHGGLEAEDFEALGSVIDQYIDSRGILQGLIIDVDSFRGWDDFAALKAHVSFVRTHHNKIARVALVGGSTVINVLPAVAEFFVQAEIRYFDTQEDALKWIVS